VSTPRARRRKPSIRTTANAVDVAPFTIVVDTREQTPWLFDSIAADASQTGGESGCIVVPIKSGTLASGDYSIEGHEAEIAVERKSLVDLFGTIGGGRDRFIRELERLAEMQFASVIAEAELSTILTSPPRHTQTTPKTILRSVLAWMQRYPRVHWIFAPGRDAAERIGYRVLERYWKDRETRNEVPAS
jgi:ERCC4-type nuclease